MKMFSGIKISWKKFKFEKKLTKKYEYLLKRFLYEFKFELSLYSIILKRRLNFQLR